MKLVVNVFGPVAQLKGSLISELMLCLDEHQYDSACMAIVLLRSI
jgi:hypothetical protein